MKKTITTITLAMIMVTGATLANAGIIVSDRADTPKGQCSDTKTLDGIIVESFGIIVEGIIVEGIIVEGTGTKSDCKSSIGKTGIIVERDGIIVE